MANGFHLRCYRYYRLHCIQCSQWRKQLWFADILHNLKGSSFIMKNRFTGSKVVLGLLTILLAGMSSAGAGEASDKPSAKKQSSAKKEKAKKEEGPKNYDEMVAVPAGEFIFGRPGS
ncbi:MAG: hypothetical protein HY935_05485, partial [Nitrosomonadales bacterium]|nr:hypothetical protein [Nitrosomonadales bacterium]